MVKGKPFHEALWDAMKEKRYADRNLARGVSVPEARVRAWRKGEELPTRAEFGRICTHLNRMRNHFPEKFQEKQAVVAVTRVEVLPASLPPGSHGQGDHGPESFGGSDYPEHRSVVEYLPQPPPRAKTFGEALCRERELEGISQAELAAMLGCTGGTVSLWESGGNTPIKEHYDGLLSLLPRLTGEPEPGWQDIPKPGPKGAARLAHLLPVPPDPQARPAAAPPPPAAPEAADPVERLLASYAEVHGGVWGVSFDREMYCDGSPAWVVHVRGGGSDYMATGSLRECYRKLYEELDKVLERKIESLEKRRAEIRGVT